MKEGVERHGNLQKYRNPNPIQRYLLGRFLDGVATLAGQAGGRTLLDVGCAEGFVLKKIEQQGSWKGLIGLDLDAEALARGRDWHPGLHFCQGEALALPFPDRSFDLILLLEVLEHLPNPSEALREIERVTRRWALISVPHEPFFRLANLLRGKHLRRLGDDPEHVQHWGERGFRRLLQQHFRVRRSQRPFPWLLALVERRG